MRIGTSFGSLVLAASTALACGARSIEDAPHLSAGAPGSSGGMTSSGGTTSSGGSVDSGGSNSGGSNSGGSDSGGSSPDAGAGFASGMGGVSSGASGGAPTAGSAPEVPMGGSSGASGGETSMGGVAGASGGDGGVAAGGAGAGAGGGPDPYAPRTGGFKMLVYPLTKLYRHSSIEEGEKMLQDIATAQGFEVTIAQDNSEITEAGLAEYEIVFFMNTSGDVFNADQERAFEAWMRKQGAFAGCHAAADTEPGWAFYAELTGQYNDPHDFCCIEADIQWEPGVETLPMVRGLPSPWTRAEEWFGFNSYRTWSTKPGFKILSTVTTTSGGTRPVSYLREWENFRSFYTSLGHESSTFGDEYVRKHIAAGIMWAVRREALLR